MFVRPKHAGEKTCPVAVTHQASAPIVLEWDLGIRSALSDGIPGGVKVDIEYLNFGISNGDDPFDEWSELLRHKYATRKFDLIVPVCIDAFRFALKYRDELFPNVPMVYCSINRCRFLEFMTHCWCAALAMISETKSGQPGRPVEA